MSFTQVFGGQNISPSQLSYSSLALSADTQLYWPLETSSSGPYVTSKLEVTPSGAGLSIIMPNATQVTPGEDCLVINPSAFTLIIKAYDGSTIGTVAPGLAWLFWVKTNSTEAGTWGSIQYGAGSSSVSASALAGLGLTPIATLLNTAFRTTDINANYAAGANDRASLVNSTGGAITLSLASSATLGSNWFCLVRNSGSGSLTIDPNGSETIDGAATKVLTIGESCFIICDGSNLFSVGYGRSITNTVSSVNIAASGSGVQTLSSAEVASQIQAFSGTLSGNQQFEYGTAPGFWFIDNSLTLSGHVATWRVNNIDAGVTSADVASGTRAILVSNGANMFLAVSTNAGTVTQINTGTGLTGGPITGSGTIAVANTAVTPGAYRLANVTLNAQGQATAASNATPAVTVSGNLVSFNDATGTAVADTGIAASDVDRLSVAQTMTAAKRGAVSTVAYASSIALDLATANNFQVTLTGAVTFANPTNQVAGQSGVIRVVQNGTGGWAASFGTAFNFPDKVAPVMNTTANAVNLFPYYVEASGEITVVLIPNVGQ